MKLLFNLPGSCGIAFLMGIISGYPVGAKMAGDLYSKGLCSKTEAERMTAFCNNSGPLFIVGSVACGMLNNPEFGLILYLSHIIGSVITGIIYRFYKNNYIDHTIKKTNINKIRNVDSFSQVFTNAIINSVNLVLFIAGFIIFFAVLSDMLKTLGIVDYICYISMTIIPSINNDLLTALIYGFLEITNGLFLLSKSTIGIDTKLVFTSLIIGWAGLSVHFQVAGILFKHNFNLKPYLIGKTIQSITSAIIAILFLKLNIFHNVNTVSLISYNGVKSISFYNYQISIIFILIILTTISIPFLNKIIRNKLQ
jgi:sporulation integral membrane protein YlbJ